MIYVNIMVYMRGFSIISLSFNFSHHFCPVPPYAALFQPPLIGSSSIYYEKFSPIPTKTHYIPSTQTDWLALSRETTHTYSESHAK